MASILDLGIFDFLVRIFVLLLIYAIVYAVLNRVKIFGEGSVNAWIAFVIALIFVLMERAVEFIRVVTPWFVVLMFIGFSILLLFMLMGLSSEDITNLAKDTTVYWTAIIIGIIIVVGGLVSVFGEFFAGPATTVASETIGGEIKRTIFHPRILAAVFTLLIASFAIKLISSKAA